MEQKERGRGAWESASGIGNGQKSPSIGSFHQEGVQKIEAGPRAMIPA